MHSNRAMVTSPERASGRLADDMARGHHKVFLGMAAGVGKTYRMLQEGHAEADAGRDVVIGYLEPHARADTIAQAVRSKSSTGT
jgi:K+-sensing histidine kinase KdpD